MKKISRSDFFQILSLLISVFSIAIAYFAYKQSIEATKASIEAGRSKVEVTFEGLSLSGGLGNGAQREFYDVCYLPENGVYAISYNTIQGFVVKNTGGLDVSLLSVFYYYRRADRDGGGEGIQGYHLSPGDQEELRFPLHIPAGTGQIIYLESWLRHYSTDNKEYISRSFLEQNKILTEATWQFEFSDGSVIVKQASDFGLHVTDENEIKNCNGN